MSSECDVHSMTRQTNLGASALKWTSDRMPIAQEYFPILKDREGAVAEDTGGATGVKE
jgi:hypothetical protein